MLCFKAREILIEEANVQTVDSPVTVSPPRAIGARLLIVQNILFRRSVEISMASSLISWSSSRWAGPAHGRTISSWVRSPFTLLG
jgi:hypothetical protein